MKTYELKTVIKRATMKLLTRVNKAFCLVGTLTILSACGGGSSDSSNNAGGATPTPPVSNTPQCTGVSLADGNSCVTINSRESIMYSPSTSPEGIALFLHGSPGSATKVMRLFDAKMIADTYNLVALSPQGTVATWGWSSGISSTQTNNADVNYLNELISKVQSEQNISTDKLYVFGYSAGGFMSYTLACHTPEKITGIIALAGQFRGEFDACTTSTSVNLHHFHSPTDSEVPYDGGTNGAIQSVDDTIAHWRVINGCDETFETIEQEGVTPNSSGTTTERYNNCSSSLSLSKMSGVSHEADYQPESLHSIYKHLLVNE